MGGLLGLQQCTFDVGNESLVFLLCSETELRHPEHSRPQKTNQRKKGDIKKRERVKYISVTRGGPAISLFPLSRIPRHVGVCVLRADVM